MAYLSSLWLPKNPINHIVSRLGSAAWHCFNYLVPVGHILYSTSVCTVASVLYNIHHLTVFFKQEAQLSQRDRTMYRVNWNLANCHATVQKLLIRQLLTKSMAWSWRFSPIRDRQFALNHDAIESAAIVSSVINKRTTFELCISPVYRRLAVAKFSKSIM